MNAPMERMTATSPPFVSTSLAPITVHANVPDTVIMAVFASVCLRLSKFLYCYNFLNIAFIYFFFLTNKMVSQRTRNKLCIKNIMILKSITINLPFLS